MGFSSLKAAEPLVRRRSITRTQLGRTAATAPARRRPPPVKFRCNSDPRRADRRSCHSNLAELSAPRRNDALIHCKSTNAPAHQVRPIPVRIQGAGRHPPFVRRDSPPETSRSRRSAQIPVSWVEARLRQQTRHDVEAAIRHRQPCRGAEMRCALRARQRPKRRRLPTQTPNRTCALPNRSPSFGLPQALRPRQKLLLVPQCQWKPTQSRMRLGMWDRYSRSR